MLEKTVESPLDCKEIQPVHPKGDQSWIFIGRTDAEAEAPVLWPPDHQKRPWCWERLKAGEGDNRGWDGWMVSQTQWTRVWASSMSWWCTGKPGMLQSMGLQIMGHDWPTEQYWTGYAWGTKNLWNVKSRASHRFYPIQPQLSLIYLPVHKRSLRLW